MSFDAVAGQEFISALDWIYVIVGEYDAAIDQLEVLLSIPGAVTVAVLKFQPEWRPLDDLPRFQQLLRKYN